MNYPTLRGMGFPTSTGTASNKTEVLPGCLTSPPDSIDQKNNVAICGVVSVIDAVCLLVAIHAHRVDGWGIPRHFS
jgi:hypothetical protein